MPKEPAADVTAARKLLEVARDSLDQAVATLPGLEDDDTAMATPALLELLLNAVRAKRQLDSVELLVTAPTVVPSPVRPN
jgi:hypothetical protein